ncbi:Iinterferon-induced GTP-binding protein Mx2 [Colletotrichum musicola]|uniref:Iinterferon-induced GTP-binding protein Mx2 n=1 Tax=Colletotrichum musicola TaxID=2175873 RepID=A0A8H6NLT0_9PEZI|nr:Iinterferon-induced GTP-binding protein Mx2 [Colletotrichum musicola]
MAPVQSTAQPPGLGNRILLDKIDKLRELGISKQVPLPQLVVVGDQSSGKSSVLESLTGYYFPRSVGLCTRHATEIVCRRESTPSIVVTVHPFDASPAKAALAKSFKRVLQDLKGGEFGKVLKEASEIMGLKSTTEGPSEGAAFSKDILRVEICGPDEEHLTIIDVPGIFENPQEGFSTTHGVALVKSMVKDYIKDSRTIIPAVIPCNVDVATQTILTYAAEADPEGKRTLGVLTKPDLVSETATRQAAMDLVRDDTSSSKDERNLEEKLFFEQDPWSKLDKSRLGIPALRKRLRELLRERTKSEFPKVRRDIQQQLTEARAELEDLGQPRSTADEQRAYLGKIVSRFSELKNFGLDAYYTGDPVFEKRPELKLVTRIREMNTAFSSMFFKNGHTRNFEKLPSDDDLNVPEEDYLPFGPRVVPKHEDGSEDSASETREDMATRNGLYSLTFSVPPDDLDELDGILSEPYLCPPPDDSDIMKHPERLFLTSRGYEMGTFGGQMLPTAFKEQSKKWEAFTLAHVSNVILVVHRFIFNVVQEACVDQQVRETLWPFVLEDLVKRYQGAMDHAKFLIHVEREGRSITYNPVFDQTFDKVKVKRSSDRYEDLVITMSFGEKYVRWSDLRNPSNAATGIEETCHTIHDVLQSYYDIARARFVDMVCPQVVDQFLLGGDKSPLGVLSPNRVFEMSGEQLEMVAGEDSVTKSTREMLVNNINMFEAVKKILRA